MFLSAPALAQNKRKNPTSKLYVTDVAGDAEIDTGETVTDLDKRSVHDAQGTVIQTKKAGSEDGGKTFSTMVFSNGTGAFFDEDTRVEVKKFVQEPFTPNRNDYDVEPSISQTQAFVSRGIVGLCTSKLVAGSNMTYSTPHGSVNIRGQKVIIETHEDVTKVSMLEGDSTVRTNENDLGGYTLHVGEQAVIRRPSPNQPAQIQIQRIPPAELPALDEKINAACNAKQTVYFEVRERKGSEVGGGSEDDTGGNAGASGSTDRNGGGVTAFDGSAGGSGGSGSIVREIVPVPVVPVDLPRVDQTVSPASLPSTRPGG
jgi:hypothetical protein